MADEPVPPAQGPLQVAGPPASPIPGLAKTRFVLYRMHEHEAASSTAALSGIPAVVVRVNDAASGSVNLQLLPDGSNDLADWKNDRGWRTSVAYDPTAKTPGTWSFPPRV
jgi:hypothetical protein